MTIVDVVDLSSDDELGEFDVQAVKLELNLAGSMMQQKENSKPQLAKHQISKTSTRQEQNGSLNSSSAGHSNSRMLDQGQSPADEMCLSSTSSISPAPLCRQFWKAGNYDDTHGSKVKQQNGKNYLQVHPRFLHSNATSHKWAFGAIAELLDNAIDEIQNGATFVSVDKIANPRNGSSALLFQDDGGGMCPEAMRRCMSFGFTEKSAKSAIGRYGNGFKTSTMRLGGDVIVFSRHYNNRVWTQSIGLLSYTFLRKTGYDRIVVPMVHYELNSLTGKLNFLHGEEHFRSNLSKLLQWSPFSTEAELLKQFDGIRSRGTKVIIYNLWFGDDGNEEFDYDTDPKDIRINGDTRKIETIPAWKTVNEQHIGNTFRFSLRVYLSILYLKMPETFRIILRGEDVVRYNIADDLKYTEYILYKPQTGGGVEAKVVTTIGFLKDAPQVNIHGFNVYHKNRLILPFWQVVNYLDSRGRGVVGILEANFVEPTHNKQDFEKTSLFQKLETRLKEMTWEYWDFHCGLLGYQEKKKPKVQMTPKVPLPRDNCYTPVGFAKPSRKLERPHPNLQSRDQQVLNLKRKEHGNTEDSEKAKRLAVKRINATDSGQRIASEPASRTVDKVKNQEAINLMQENEKLRAKCLDYEREEEELSLKVMQIENEIKAAENEYSRLLSELLSRETTKPEKNV